MYAIVNGDPQHEGGKDNGQEVQMTHHQGGHGEGPAEAHHQHQGLYERALQTAEKHNQEEHLTGQGQPGGQGDVLHGAAHFVRF